MILISTGLGTTRLFYSVLAWSVSQFGCIVVIVDHPYDTDIVEFTSVYGYSPILEPTQEQSETTLAVRVQDLSFVLNELDGAKYHFLSLTSGFDGSKVGIFGHSIGGATAAAATLEDS